MGTDRDWERWGAKSPYFGVLSVQRFSEARFDEEARAEFFESGEAHVRSLFAVIDRREGRVWRPRIAVDLGCGVGRLAIPLARSSDKVIAVDVSPSMLFEVERNCRRCGVANLSAVLSDDSLSKVPDGVDFFHSYLVLQHIPTSRGMRLIRQMAGRISEGGYVGFQVYTGCNAGLWLRLMVRLRYVFKPLNWLRNILRKRPVFEQAMQLHVYPLGALLRLLRENGFVEVELFLDTEDGGNFESAFLLAKKQVVASSIVNRYS
jgi:SAM-dependent methyltransferase